MRRWIPGAVGIVALALTGCGGGSPPQSTHHTAAATATTTTTTGTTGTGKTVKVCSGLTDKCTTIIVHPGAARAALPHGCVISDVSSYQGHPDWNAAKPHICGAIFKGGEYTTDPDAAYNAARLRALGIWHAMYWFVRNTGCSHEAAQIIALARFLHVMVVINDLEVPEAAGYGACLVPLERHAGLTVDDYTGPGTWPGGGYGLAPLWQATYGPSFTPFWHPVVAWQFTDRLYIPGIGYGDASVDYGITKQGVVDPYAIYPKHVFHFRSRHTAASEYRAVRRWDRRGCRNPVRRKVCKRDRVKLLLLAGRIKRVAHGHDWRFHRRARLKGIERRLHHH